MIGTLPSFSLYEKESISCFRRKVRSYYRRKGRAFPWRETADPWAILISEVMLQQTQTARVAERFPAFLRRFPTPRHLDRASLSEVLKLWQGMGYNRRAKCLWKLSHELVSKFDGQVPQDIEQLRALPGIGPYTAGAIAAFAFNQRGVFLETNIRAALIAEFFPGRNSVSDQQLAACAAAVLPRTKVALWYHALMDYGAWIKRQQPDVTSRAKAYAKQSPFHGSLRQLRGRLLRAVLTAGSLREADLGEIIAQRPAEGLQALEGLVKDGLLERRGGRIRPSDH